MPLSDTYVDSDTLGKRYEEIVKLSEVPSLQNIPENLLHSSTGKVRYMHLFITPDANITAFISPIRSSILHMKMVKQLMPEISLVQPIMTITVLSFIILPLICQLTMNEMIYQRIFGLVPVFA